MKKIAMLLLCLGLTSCTEHIQRIEAHPSFKAGQCVEFSDSSFYSNCSGSITSYTHFMYTENGEKQPTVYKVKFICISEGSLFATAQGETEVPESELKPCSK